MCICKMVHFSVNFKKFKKSGNSFFNACIVCYQKFVKIIVNEAIKKGNCFC